MAVQVTINSLTGTSPYNVYICDTTLISCVYLATINDGDLPFTIEVPAPYDTMIDFSVKIVDANNCEIIKTF